VEVIDLSEDLGRRRGDVRAARHLEFGGLERDQHDKAEDENR
jgi:hypothetical protein